MGFVLSGMNFGLLVSPFLGGLIYEKLGYYAVFYTSLGVTGFAFLWRLATVEQGTAAKWSGAERVEEPSINGFVSPEDNHHVSDCNTLAGHEPRSQTGEPTESTALLRDGLKKPASQLARNRSTMAILLRSPRLRAAVCGSFTLFVLTTAFDGILPLFVIRTFGWNASGAGLIFLAITCPSILGVVYGLLSDRFGPKKVSLTGFVITTISLGSLSFTVKNSFSSQILLCVLLAIIGLPASISGCSEEHWGANSSIRYRMQSHPGCSCGRPISRSRNACESKSGPV